ncbi:MAG TPA: anti-sigma factor [Blastocatellia bacterium]|nr:anti-sigma factor [Blastocatellia bacterium]
MKCEDFLPIIETYVDGELDGETAQRVRTHLAMCDSCQEFVADLRQEQEVYALYNRELDITPAMWAAVAARIEKEKPVRPTNILGNVTRWLGGLMGTPRLSPALAAALIVATVGTTVVVMNYLNSRESNVNTGVVASRPEEEVNKEQPKPQPPQPQPSLSGVKPPQGGEEIASANTVKRLPEREKPVAKPAVKTAPTPEQLVREAEEKYLSAIAILEKDVSRNKSKLDPMMVVRFEKAMVDIDNTIAETRRAVRENPEDPIALQYMLSAYAKKVDVLREMARSN